MKRSWLIQKDTYFAATVMILLMFLVYEDPDGKLLKIVTTIVRHARRTSKISNASCVRIRMTRLMMQSYNKFYIDLALDRTKVNKEKAEIYSNNCKMPTATEWWTIGSEEHANKKYWTHKDQVVQARDLTHFKVLLERRFQSQKWVFRLTIHWGAQFPLKT